MLRNYVLTAYRVGMRRKMFTLVNLLCIVLTLTVLVVATALLENAFFPTGVEGKSNRMLQVVMMQSVGPGEEGNRNQRTGSLGFKVIDTYLMPMQSVERVSAVTWPQTVSVYQGGRATQLQMRRTDANYWKILDFTVLGGRLPSEDDVAQGRFVAVINRSTATRLFSDAQAVGQSMNVSGQEFDVIGVVEDVIHLNALADIWTPVTTFPNTQYRSEMTGPFTALLLAKDVADLPAIRAEVARLASTVEFDDPKKWRSARFWADDKLDLFARTLVGDMEHADSGASTLLGWIGGLMLLFMLLPALNLVNLNMGRILERSAEIGVRKAFGATSMQLVAQLVVENLLLSLLGGVLGLLLAEGVLLGIEGTNLIPYLKLSINFNVFGCGLLLSLVFGLLSGALPAWKMARLDPVLALKGIA